MSLATVSAGVSLWFGWGPRSFSLLKKFGITFVTLFRSSFATATGFCNRVWRLERHVQQMVLSSFRLRSNKDPHCNIRCVVTHVNGCVKQTILHVTIGIETCSSWSHSPLSLPFYRGVFLTVYTDAYVPEVRRHKMAITTNMICLLIRLFSTVFCWLYMALMSVSTGDLRYGLDDIIDF